MKPREFRLHFSPSQIAEEDMICAVEVKSRKLKITHFEIIDVIEIRAYQALEQENEILKSQIESIYTKINKRLAELTEKTNITQIVEDIDKIIKKPLTQDEVEQINKCFTKNRGFMNIKEKRYEQLQPFITEMGGWANFKHYVKYHDKIINLIELAEEVMTHPAVFSEAELGNESLKIRRDKFMNLLHKITKRVKND